MNKVNLFSDILPVRGYMRSMLFDSTRIKVHFFDNLSYDTLKSNSFKKVNLNDIDPLFKSVLLENELIFSSNEALVDSFPRIIYEWDNPYQITNAVIYASILNCDNLFKIQYAFFIAHFNFILNNSLNFKAVDQIFILLNNHICDSVEFTFIEELNDKLLNKIEDCILATKKIVRLNRYSENKFKKEVINNNRHNIGLDHLDLKLSLVPDHFFESDMHHTYFNRKLFIGIEGEIKNAPECETAFGSLAKLKVSKELLKIIKKSDFQKYWFIKKEDTDVCKDCELRNLCVDNRLPIERNKDEWYHNEECTYNPYICKWFDEEGYQTLEQCGVISNETGFTIDHEKIAKINAILWDEEEVEIE